MDIFKMALVIIYPDGYVDPIPIKEDVNNHVEYFYEYLQSSPRFQQLVRENHFKFDWINDYNCYPICKLLVQNNVICMMNIAITYVLMAMENAESISRFVISLPRSYETLPGLPFTKEQIKKLSDDQFEIEKYRIDWNDFEELDTEEYERFLERDKEEEKKI